MSKYGYNEKELRKTIITKIDKDGFHNRTVVYGKDSGESGSGSSDWTSAKVTFADSNASGEGYSVLCPIVVDTGNPEIGIIFSMSSGSAGFVNHDKPITLDIPLFKGACYLPVRRIFISGFSQSAPAPELTGNVTIYDGTFFLITGDATITLQSIGDEPPADEPPAE